MEVLFVKSGCPIGTEKGQLRPGYIVQKLKESKEHVSEKTSLEHDSAVGPGLHYHNVVDYCLSKLRPRVRLLAKKLLLDPADVPIVLQLLLQQRNKEILLDSDVVVSDVLELYNLVDKCRREGKFPPTTTEEDKPVAMAAQDYKVYLNKCNLFDEWAVVGEVEKLKEEGEAVGEGECLVVVGAKCEGAERRLCEILGGGVARVVEVECGLDLSGLEDGVEPQVEVQIGEAKTVEEVFEEVGEREKEIEASAAEVTVGSYLRLLVNSRDELALARAITGPAHNLHQAHFTVIRQKAKETNMPMYQTIVSYVQQLILGGRKAPTDDHPFFEFQDVLKDFVSLMEKFQTRVEETGVAGEAVGRVVSGALSWLRKTGVNGVDKVEPVMTRLGTEAERRTLACVGSTPARTVGCGGSMAGRPAVKMLREVVDQLSHRGECDRSGHLAHKNAKTPNNKTTNLISFFKTPGPDIDAEDDEDDDEFKIEPGLAERLGVDSKDLTPVAVVPAYRRFQSASNWAMDSSPLLARSAERKVRTEGRTLMAAASPATPQEASQDTRQILREIEEREKQDEEEMNVAKKAKVPKRCLAKEVDAELRNKMGMVEKPTKKRKLDEENKEKPAKKKEKPLMKGQMTLTSFFKK